MTAFLLALKSELDSRIEVCQAKKILHFYELRLPDNFPFLVNCDQDVLYWHTIHPNPTIDVINLQLQSYGEIMFDLRVWDVNGFILYSEPEFD
ncbi:MAG: hypothetical protein GY751_17060 [Bacteroidetes bacterium]|nr:hypothetical protein [Bacteroidota bacterium]